MANDFTVENHGSIFLFRPVSERATQFIEDNMSEAMQYFGNAIVVEPRYVCSFIDQLHEEGLVCGQ